MRPESPDVGQHLRDIRGGATIGFVFKGVAFGGTLLLSIVAARMLGASESGLFFLSLTIVTILATLSRMGLDKPLVRHIAAARAGGDQLSLRTMATTCVLLVTGLSLAFAAASALSGTWVSDRVFGKPELAPYLVTMSLAIPTLAVSGFVGLAFQGTSRIALHLLFFSVLTPFAVIAVYLGASLFGLTLGLAESFAIGAFVSALLAVIAWQLTLSWPAQLLGWRELAPILASSRATLTIIVLQLMMTWIPTVLLGILAESGDISAYHVATRTALLIGFVLVAVNGIAAPKFASLHATGQLQALEATVIRTTRIATLAALPICLVFLVWPEAVLALFGNDFRSSGSLLRVLAIGYLVNTSTGSVANLLMMTGHERDYRNICIVGAALNAIIASVAIRQYGAVGAASATAATLIVISLGAAEVSRRRLGFSGLVRSATPARG